MVCIQYVISCVCSFLHHSIYNTGLSAKHMDEDRQEIERLKLHVVEAERRVLQLEAMLEQRDGEIDRLKQVPQSSDCYCLEEYI